MDTERHPPRPEDTINLWLASLGERARRQLEPHLREARFEQGERLYDSGQAVDTVWFPVRGVVSLMTVLDDDRMVETAVIGREGLVGVTCGPMNGRAVSRAIAQTPGMALCADADSFGKVLDAHAEAREALSRYTEALFAQVQQTAACNAQHRLEERFARWLLTLHDRAGGDTFHLTQSDIAGMLGARRATVSEIGSALEAKGLIERGRGKVTVLDRAGLESASCGCYAAIASVLVELDVSPVRDTDVAA